MSELDVAEMMNATDAKREACGFEQLNEAERVVTLISYARFEIEMGELDGFYYNSAGDYAVETVWALEQIGALEAARVLRQANAEFPQGAPSKYREVRYYEWKQFEDKLDAMTTQFYSAANSDGLDDLIDSYIEMHQSELPGSGEYR